MKHGRLSAHRYHQCAKYKTLTSCCVLLYYGELQANATILILIEIELQLYGHTSKGDKVGWTHRTNLPNPPNGMGLTGEFTQPYLMQVWGRLDGLAHFDTHRQYNPNIFFEVKDWDMETR